jgi:dephospho-CoA kinase
MAASAQSFARIDTPEIDARQARQEARIERGMARGEFTRREARALHQSQREIARAEARAKADGYVSRYEIRHLTAMLDQADLQIRQMRHDRDGHRPV